MCSSRYRSRDLCSHSWRAQHLHKLFGILLHGRFVPSPPVIYLFSHLFTAVQAHGYLFSASGYNPARLCWSPCSRYSRPGHQELCQLAPVPLWYPAVVVRCTSVFVSVFISFFVLFVSFPLPRPAHTHKGQHATGKSGISAALFLLLREISFEQ